MADVGLAMQRAEDKTENMRARADAVEELERRGRSTTSPSSAPVRTTSTASWPQIGAGAQVDDELAKMKAELGSGGGEESPQLEQGEKEGA